MGLDRIFEGSWPSCSLPLPATSSSFPASPPSSGAPKKEVYFMAIIDILTPYDAKKKAAHAAKTVKHGVSAPCPRPDSVGGPQAPRKSAFRPPALRRHSPPPLRAGSRKSSLLVAWCSRCHLHPTPGWYAQLVFPFVLWPSGLRAC